MTSRIQPQLLRRMTVRRILETLQNCGPASRAELTRSSGISAPTVSKAVASLLEAGILEEGEANGVSLGRPGRLLRLANQRAQVLGVVIDPVDCTVVSSGLDAQIIDERTRRFETPASYTELLDELTHCLQSFVVAPDVTTLGIGLSIPGLVNRRSQTAVFSPNLHMTDGCSPARDLQQRLGIECVLLQETHALCLSERMLGGARGLNDFAMLDVSTGLGLGVVTEGRVLTGQSGLAGELGHLTIIPDGRQCGCGNRGCLETLATDTALAAAVSEQIGRSVTVDEAVARIQQGHPGLSSALEQTCEYLAIAMAAAINLFNPATLFVHGRLFDAQSGVFDDASNRARARALKPSSSECEIVQARGSKRQGALAGIIHHLTDTLGPVVPV